MFKAFKRFLKLATYSGNIQNTVEYENSLKQENQKIKKEKGNEGKKRRTGKNIG